MKAVIKNVVFYLQQLCSNARDATAAATAVGTSTVTIILNENDQLAVEKTRGRQPAAIDTFDKSVIRRIVHQFFSSGEQPTRDKMLVRVK